jgi:hypothetical protein
VIFTTGSLPPTASYPHRDYSILAGLDWGDGRDCTVVLGHTTAKTRLGRNRRVSRYAVSEVNLIGFAGRAFVWDKEMGEDEHGEPRPGVPLPPYTVRLSAHGEIWCGCMAGNCKAPTCRHCDMTLVLIDEGVFTEQLQGA